MNHDEKLAEAVAKQYVDKQFETMKKYGSAPRDISEHEYRSLVREVAEKLDLK